MRDQQRTKPFIKVYLMPMIGIRWSKQVAPNLETIEMIQDREIMCRINYSLSECFLLDWQDTWIPREWTQLKKVHFLPVKKQFIYLWICKKLLVSLHKSMFILEYFFRPEGMNSRRSVNATLHFLLQVQSLASRPKSCEVPGIK